MIDIRLKVFITVAQHLSFSKASHILYISQPAVSKHIAELEKEYDVRLFDRMGNKIQLTYEGKKLLHHAYHINKAYEQLNFEMNLLQKKTAGTVRIGASTTIAQYVLPEILATFLVCYPQIHVNMISSNSHEIETMLKEGVVDLGLVEGIGRQPEMKYTKFMKDELVTIVSSKNKLAEKDEITIDELKSQPLVMREFGSGSLDVIEKHLKKRGVSLSELNIIVNFGTTEGIKSFVEKYDAMGILSIRAVNKEILRGQIKVIDIKNLTMNRFFSIVQRHGMSSGVQSLFIKHIIKSYSI